MANTAFLQLPLLTTTQAGKEITLNSSLQILDSKVRQALCLPLFHAGAVVADQLIAGFVAPQALTLLTAGHAARAHTPGVGASTLELAVNGVAIGTVAFASGASEGVFSIAAPVAMVLGDLLTVTVGAGASGALTGIALTLQIS